MVAALSAALLLACGLGLLSLIQRKRITRLQTILDGLDQGALLLDPKDRILSWNEPLMRLRGISAERLLAGMPIDRFLAGAERYRSGSPSSSDGQLWYRALHRGEYGVRDVELENGRTLQIGASRLLDDTTLLVYSDVGQIKESQLAYRDLATRLATTLDNVLDAIITINDRGVVDSFSAGAEQMFGYTANEVIGRNVKLLMPDAFASMHDGYLEAYRRTGEPHIMRKRREVEAKTKSGRQFPIELGVSEMNVGGQRTFVGIIRDISERRRVERAQEEFVATVTHELRTPLTSIIASLGLMQTLSGGTTDAKAHRLLDIAWRNGRRLQQLIDDILDAAKSNESLELSLEPQSVLEVTTQTVDANQTYAAGYDVKLALTCDDADVTAWIDAGRLQQVLSNLISNAIKHSPKGETVSVLLTRDSRFAVLQVRDRGPGIPKSFQPRVFEKFSQADASDTRKKGGTGLGLYIARNLVERMGGHLAFHTIIDQGTTFTVHLPLHRKLRAAAAAAATVGPAEERNVVCAR